MKGGNERGKRKGERKGVKERGKGKRERKGGKKKMERIKWKEKLMKGWINERTKGWNEILNWKNTEIKGKGKERRNERMKGWGWRNEKMRRRNKRMNGWKDENEPPVSVRSDEPLPKVWAVLRGEEGGLVYRPPFYSR